MKILGKNILLTLSILAAVTISFLQVQAAPLTGSQFWDQLNTFDQSRWAKSDGWSNGLPFIVGWRADHIVHSNGFMTLNLNNTACPGGCSGQKYASGEYRSLDFYGYGCYAASLKAASGSGLDLAFFTYKGPSDVPPGGNGSHNEVDVEILGKNTTQVQFTYFTNDRQGHEYLANLGFDAAAAFHTYAFKWTESGIQWYVDGHLLHSVTSTAGDPTPLTTSGGPHKIMMNFWACSDIDPLNPWCYPFTYSGQQQAQFDWVKYQPGSACVAAGNNQIYLPFVLKAQ